MTAAGTNSHIATVQGEANAWADASRQKEDEEKQQKHKKSGSIGAAGGDTGFEVENPVFNE